MSTSPVSTARTASPSIEVTAADLQGPGVVFCPNPKMTQWSSHPKVFIDLSHHGEGRCPYCGTGYHLKAGEKIAGHH